MPAVDVDFDKSVGFGLPTQPVSWNRRDVLLYNVGLNVPPSELEYIYEKTDAFRAIPTYPLVLGFKGTSDEVTDFADMVGGRGEIPGFPSLDPNTLVHAEQSLDIHRPLPVISGPGWKLRKRVSGVHDKKSGLILEQETQLIDPVGRLTATMVGVSSVGAGWAQKNNALTKVANCARARARAAASRPSTGASRREQTTARRWCRTDRTRSRRQSASQTTRCTSSRRPARRPSTD